MRCIFCKKSSSSSKSVEHIIPESLGNKRHVLPKGIVCDGCNNYFSRKVEKQFLDLPAVRQLRFQQDIESKRGNIPSISGLIAPDIPALLTKYPKYDFTSVQVSEPDLARILQAKEGTMLFPLAGDLPNTPVVSRFLAKIALEAMALRLAEFPEGIAYICDEAQFDVLRDHARKGYVSPWPVHIRTIYHQNGKTFGPKGNAEQIVHEFDFLVTDQSEWFFSWRFSGWSLRSTWEGPKFPAVGVGSSKLAALAHYTPTGMAALLRCPNSNVTSVDGPNYRSRNIAISGCLFKGTTNRGTLRASAAR
ncbi:HNH endonuclease [Agrobacterium vitis]|uniref:HNH endonuclease n=1 Tax=Agrobacterium vitis TaxID=373 RepID=UPI0012E78A0E